MKRTFRQILIAIALVLLATGCAGKKPKGGGGGGDGPGPGGDGGGGGGKKARAQPQSIDDILGQNEEIARLKDDRDALRKQLDSVLGVNALNQGGNGFNTGGAVVPDNFSAGPSLVGGVGTPAGVPDAGSSGAPALSAADLAGAGGSPATGGGTKGSVVEVGSLPGTDPNAGLVPSASRFPASTLASDTTHAAP